MTVKVYVEGGGDHNKALQTQCRQGFSDFFRRAGFTRPHMPSVVACGRRQHAYDSFRKSHENAGQNDVPVLLVDSEAPVVQADPWEHVRRRVGDGWQRPAGASNEQIHFMVQAMEAWFFADKEEIEKYFGQGFNRSSLPNRADVENIPKDDLFNFLQGATRDCKTKGEYSKGTHSFEILGLIDPAKVKAASPHAARLLRVLDQVCAR